MSMVTRCPGCNTVFRVTPQQLQSRQGKVRCGRCALVFDGFKMLAAIPEQSAPELADVAQSGVADSPSAVPQTGVDDARVNPAAAAAGNQSSAAAADTPPPADEAKSIDRAAAGLVTAAQRLQAIEDELLAELAPDVPQHRRWMWGAGCVLLLFAITAQAVYLYRTELASYYPGIKPVLVQLCGALGCSLPLAQRHDLIKVEASDLQMVDPARPAHIQLTVTLRNSAAYDLAYPALDLVLTNIQEHTLARRIFLPKEYLAPGKDEKAGIPANAEITLSLDLDTGDLGASGFRLYLLPGNAV